jgi:hypothetical protein
MNRKTGFLRVLYLSESSVDPAIGALLDCIAPI